MNFEGSLVGVYVILVESVFWLVNEIGIDKVEILRVVILVLVYLIGCEDCVKVIGV